MAQVRLFHWNAEEAEPLLTVLQAAGHSVHYQERFALPREHRVSVPDAYLIDLSRLPSHGREVGVYLRTRKATRHIPIVFIGGTPDKIEYVRRAIPDAVYTPVSRLRSAVKSAIANPPINPLKPGYERWSNRTTAQKLGIARDSRIAVIDPPAGYAQAVGELPEGAYFEEDSTRDCGVSLWFVHGIPDFQAALPGMRKLAANSKLWILWRKNQRARTGPARPSAAAGSGVRAQSTSDGLDGNMIRAGCAAVGLVDYKICSLNDIWSGMVFAVKKARA